MNTKLTKLLIKNKINYFGKNYIPEQLQKNLHKADLILKK